VPADLGIIVAQTSDIDIEAEADRRSTGTLRPLGPQREAARSRAVTGAQLQLRERGIDAASCNGSPI
jgi:hypothetical protein